MGYRGGKGDCGVGEVIFVGIVACELEGDDELRDGVDVWRGVAVGIGIEAGIMEGDIIVGVDLVVGD